MAGPPLGGAPAAPLRDIERTINGWVREVKRAMAGGQAPLSRPYGLSWGAGGNAVGAGTTQKLLDVLKGIERFLESRIQIADAPVCID